MYLASINKDLTFNQEKPSIKVLLNTDFTKEIRIAFKAGQIMQEHSTPFPIVVNLVKGSLNFGVNGKVQQLESGDLIALDGGIKHDLKAISDCVVRLSLSKADSVKRVQNVANK